MAGLFRPRGVLSNDAKYASPARVMTVEDMLSYRDTWLDSPAEFSFEDIMAKARAALEVKPAEKLEVSEHGYRPADHSLLSERDKLIRHIQSVLNKLTETNYDALVKTCQMPEALEAAVIENWVSRIFEKALDEPIFCPIYAKFAFDMAKYELDTMHSKGVRTAIVQKAQAVHEADQAEAAASSSKDPNGRISDDEQAAAAFQKLRKKKLANIKLIGELYKGNLLTGRIIITIVTDVLNKDKRPQEVDVEMTTELLRNVGSQLEVKSNIDGVYERIKLLMDIQPPYSKRVLFAMLNLLDLRKAKWVEKKVVDAAPPPPPQLPPPSAQRPEIGTSPVGEGAPGAPRPKLGPGHVAPGPQQPTTQLPPPLPSQLNPETEREIETKLQSAALDQLHAQEKVAATVKALRQLEGGIRDALIVFAAANHACGLTQTAIGDAIFSAFVMKGIWEPSETSVGLGWCIATAIVDGVTEDVPKFFPRLAKYLVTSGWTLDRLTSDVFGRASSSLDSVYRTGECDAAMRTSACEVFGSLWDLTVQETRSQADASKDRPKATPTQILDSLAACRMTPFLRELLPDMLHTLHRLEICPTEALRAWRTAKCSAGGNFAVLCDEISLMLD